MQFLRNYVIVLQIELWAESAGLKIAGYYLANENLNDLRSSIDVKYFNSYCKVSRCCFNAANFCYCSHEKPAHRIADKINEKYRSSVLVVVRKSVIFIVIVLSDQFLQIGIRHCNFDCYFYVSGWQQVSYFESFHTGRKNLIQRWR